MIELARADGEIRRQLDEIERLRERVGELEKEGAAAKALAASAEKDKIDARAAEHAAQARAAELIATAQVLKAELAEERQARERAEARAGEWDKWAKAHAATAAPTSTSEAEPLPAAEGARKGKTAKARTALAAGGQGEFEAGGFATPTAAPAAKKPRAGKPT
ncbi:hypothetical protein [Chitinimonas lacunae]|uniref:Uncharacterized protein n=1 Tax=Chitinimonas lacunae TaxID=1963018 RepID=A0ABV8MYE0_9NEIS